jgi:hypothetical protein
VAKLKSDRLLRKINLDHLAANGQCERETAPSGWQMRSECEPSVNVVLEHELPIVFAVVRYLASVVVTDHVLAALVRAAGGIVRDYEGQQFTRGPIAG